jgi:hypothetical protein
LNVVFRYWINKFLIVNNDAAEEEEGQTSEPEVRGWGQRNKIAAHRYLGPAWEEH